MSQLRADTGTLVAVHDAGLHGIAFWEVLGWTDRAWAEGGESIVRAELAALTLALVNLPSVEALDAFVQSVVAVTGGDTFLPDQLGDAASAAFESPFVAVRRILRSFRSANLARLTRYTPNTVTALPAARSQPTGWPRNANAKSTVNTTCAPL